MNQRAPTSGSSLLRSAFLAQGLLLVCLLGAAAVSYFMGTGDDTGFMFGGVGLATAAVMCLWSLTLSIRAARNGAAWRWAGVIWFLVGIELIAPEIFYWGTLERYPHDSLYEILGIGVALPFLFVTGMYIALAALLTRVFKRRRNAVLLALFLYLPFLLLITPGAVYIVAVFNTRTPIFSIENPNQSTAIVEAVPEFIRDDVDVFLSYFPPGKIYDYHLLLCERGKLSRRRTLENLNTPGPTAMETWLALQDYNEKECLEVAVDIATERIPHTPAMVPLDRRMGLLIVATGKAEQVENVFRRYASLPVGMKSGLVEMLNRRESLAESIVFRRICTEREVLNALTSAIWTKAVDMRRTQESASQIRQIVDHWQIIKTPQLSNASSIHYRELVETCRKSTDPVIRRVGATALADLLKREIHHIPDALAETADGKPVPVTLDETEEIEALCIAAEAEVAKLSKTSAETKP